MTQNQATALAPTVATEADEGWHRLPPQARRLFMISGALLAVPTALAAGVLDVVFNVPGFWAWLPGVLLGGGLGVWLGLRRYRHTRWRLDADGFSLRKGRLWHSEIRVPVNRVQHLDLRRGPLERRYGLSTLSIHTAGTRDSAVHVGGLAQEDAERLRDLLARQGEHDREPGHADPEAGVGVGVAGNEMT